FAKGTEARRALALPVSGNGGRKERGPVVFGENCRHDLVFRTCSRDNAAHLVLFRSHDTARTGPRRPAPRARDRKSTRLNSSHQIISYAVFCLKNKNTHQNGSHTTTRHTT